MPVSKVYLDHNASTPLLDMARNEMLKVMDVPGNPSSVHANGRALANAIETARSRVADLAGAQRGQVVFTGSATESITQAIVGGVAKFALDRVVLTAGEHKAVRTAADMSGAVVEVIGLDAQGAIRFDEIEAALRAADDAGDVVLVAVHWVNSETGVVQDIARIAALVGPTKHILFVDGVQALGKIDMGFSTSGMDMLALTAHKIGGPAGVGALIVKEHCNDVRLVPGGGQEQGRRGGTQSAMLIAGFGAAAGSVGQVFDKKRLGALMARFERGVLSLGDDVVVFGVGAIRVGSVCNFALPGIASETALIGLDLKGICISAGSACSSGKISSSPVLEAMGIDADIAGCALRVSVGWNSTEEDIDLALAALSQIYGRHHKNFEEKPQHAVGS